MIFGKKYSKIKNMNIKNNSPIEIETDDFQVLNKEDFFSLPYHIIQESAAIWSESKNKKELQRARACLSVIKKTAHYGVNKDAIKIAINCLSEKECVEWISEAISAFSLAASYGNRSRLGSYDVGYLATMALVKNKPQVALKIVENSSNISSSYSVDLNEEKKEYFFELEAIRGGHWNILETVFNKIKEGETRSAWLVNSGRPLGKILRKCAHAQDHEKSWNDIKGIYLGEGGEDLAKKALSDLEDDPELLVALAFSPSKKVREEFYTVGGLELRDRWLDIFKEKVNDKESWGRYWSRYLPLIFNSKDDKLIEKTLSIFDVNCFDQTSAPSYNRMPLAMLAVKSGGEVALRGLCKAILAVDPNVGKGSLFHKIVSEKDWIWESKKSGRNRKIGDLLAFCIAEGNTDAVKTLIDISPNIDGKYAKDLVKYWKDEKIEVHGKANAIWELLLMSKIKKSNEDLRESVEEKNEKPRLKSRL